MEKYSISERRDCKIVGQNRSTQRYQEKKRPDEDILTGLFVELATEYGRYGYRMVTGVLRLEGYRINPKRVYRIWRALGLKVPAKQPKRSRLWTNSGSCIRLRAEKKNHVWSYDFMETRTSRGQKIKILNVIDEYTRECLISYPAPRIRSKDVMNVLRKLFLTHGTPQYIRSDNGSEFIAKKLREWLAMMEVSPVYILPGSPWENGFCESFNGTMANELLKVEVFHSLFEAEVLIKSWVKEYNTIRPHSALGYRPPAPTTWIQIA